jgi:alpha-glucosidase
MDWHNTFELRWQGQPLDQAGQRLGWTGYTWDRAYFPDPDAFLGWVHQQGLHTTLNLHPASGIQPHEAQYLAMARAMGIDPATRRYVPFQIEDKHFAEAYFADVIHPLERQGVDFWWLDWQAWGTTSIPGLNPTWWLNYVFFTDMERQGHRPLIFHRWGGLGNHRYQIGFSGDARSTWQMLAFETYFTATAANVGFGYWSHDIGGHIPGPVEPELYTRWIQFGAFSPILRTHTTKNANAERRIWAYPPEYADVMREAFQLRYALIPYIYTAARLAYDSGVALVHPLYYDWPDSDQAYAFPDEYVFGPDLVVSPVVTPVDSASALARVRLWLPPGEWVEWSSGARLAGPKVVDRTFALDELPVYVRAGAIVPEQLGMERSDERPTDPLILDVFPGDSGSARIYEDGGDSLGYREGAYHFTPVRQRRTGADIAVTIAPVEGAFPGMLQERGYEVRLRGTWPPARACAPASRGAGARAFRGGHKPKSVSSADATGGSVSPGAGTTVAAPAPRSLGRSSAQGAVGENQSPSFRMPAREALASRALGAHLRQRVQARRKRGYRHRPAGLAEEGSRLGLPRLLARVDVALLGARVALGHQHLAPARCPVVRGRRRRRPARRDRHEPPGVRVRRTARSRAPGGGPTRHRREPVDCRRETTPSRCDHEVTWGTHENAVRHRR